MFALQSRLSEKLTSVRVDSHYLYSIDFKPKVNFSDSRLEVNFLQFFIYLGPGLLISPIGMPLCGLILQAETLQMFS